ncbi:hypothetical protein PR003_g10864 [Phytophthora rubi]|uniref:PH domain-containing protein n=1 Tax=Phytophthora rubi TaxID=129364 RepID=A0A6A3M4I7_9STRA|nr:hypothetical protein PR002_g10887 [Phytophthora rubi]KAE9032512.1 hypothetical protein PR001_g10572 [Phytophthora rubi]KAE9339735.1 hypothetical protein PR003_g10864 [Phytophthora rubi]
MLQTSRRSLSLSSASMPTPVCSARRASWRSSARSAVSSESTSSINAGAAPVSNSSTFTLASSSSGSFDHAKGDEAETAPRRSDSTRNSAVKPASPVKSVDLAAYYTFSRRNSKIVHDDTQGLSGFLEYRKLNGTWRPFLFQTMGHQLVLYRVHSTHQVLVMSTDIRSASEIALDYEGTKDQEDTRLLRLGINGTTITLRAVTHRAAVYWVEGLQRLKEGKPLQIIRDPPCSESEDEIFDEIDKLLSQREWTPPPPTTPLCGLCISVRKPEQPTTGMLLNTKKKSLDEGASSGCRIC